MEEIKNKETKSKAEDVLENNQNIKNENEERDTSGDTKVFNRDEIEKERKRRAALKENVVIKVKAEEPEKQSSDFQEKNNNQLLNNYKESSPSMPKPRSKNNTKKVLIVLLTLIIVSLVAVIVSTIFGLLTSRSNTMIKGLKINNIDVSNMTKEQVLGILQDELNDNEKNIVIAKRGDYTKQIQLSDIHGTFKIEDAVIAGYNVGRDSDIVKNNYTTLFSMIKGHNVEAKFFYNEKALNKVINDISIDIPELATDVSYIIEGDKLIIKNSKEDVQINKQEFQKHVMDILTKRTDNNTFEIPTEKAQKRNIDIGAIYQEVHKQPVNAFYTTNPRKIYKEQEGIDFAISIEEAKKILAEDKLEYEIPLKKIKPEITVADLDEGAYPDLLGTFTTHYGTADVNRNINISLAAKSINSVIVMPGEVFSYNTLIGDCSPQNGYRAATIYMNGELSTGIGGGICQVSTTLYNAVLRANLEIVQRRNHSMGVTYVPAGHDAMVSIGTSDFQFKNNREYPVKVVAYTGTGSITCQVYGLKQDTEYEVKLQSRTIEKNEQRYKVETYKVLYLDGKEVSRTWLSTDTYKYHQ